MILITIHRGHDDIMFVRMSSQGCVIGLNIQFKVFVQSKVLKKTNNTHCICQNGTKNQCM